MKISGKKILISGLLLILLAGVIVVGGRYLVFNLIERKIRTATQAMQKDGIYIRYDTLYTDPWEGSLTMKNLRAYTSNGKKDSTDSTTHASIGLIKIEGIKILPLILHRKLSLDSVAFEHPVISWAENFRFKRTDQHKKSKTLNNISIGRLSIDSASFETLDSISYKQLKRFRFHTLTVANISLENPEKDLQWAVGSTNLDTLEIHLAKEFYTVKVNHSEYNASDKTLEIDSAFLTPDYNKREFAQKSVRQTDRIYAVIPFIKASGCEISKKANTSVTISKLTLNFNINVFRDKRYPFHNNTKTLPERFLHTLPIELQVDTLHVNNSHVLYEEFPEKGDSAGRVYFDHLQASVYNLSNISSADATMEAEANFMNAGMLKVHFIFPANPDKDYKASGTLTNFSLPKINSMLEPLAGAHVESGTMEEMKFHFAYNDYRSDGEVELNYSNLKMASHKESSLGNKIVTVLLNTLIRNTMDKNTATAKKTGTILFYRDHQRAIFNYWWKSLLSGIKSVYNLDKITNTSSNKKK